MSTATPSPAALVNRPTSAPAPREGLDVERIFDGTRLVLLGGTGFLGKVFLAMLLERFPNIGQVFLMVRAGKGKTSDERFWSDIATSDALRSLRNAIDLGYRDFDWMQQDPDLAALKAHPAFLALLDQLKPQS